ncbi:MAG: pseudouridine synthase [Caulobacteraceae bacterium]
MLYEDADLIVVDKPAGMAVHPAPGSQTGTLVNALLAHCGGKPVGDRRRGPGRGIVHRLDKDTSGVMVAARPTPRTRASRALFARHDIERAYIALTRGRAPPAARGPSRPASAAPRTDRKKMAVLRTAGARGGHRLRRAATFGPQDRPLAARVECRLRTGPHPPDPCAPASKGCPCLGDPVYGSGPPAPAVRARSRRRPAPPGPPRRHPRLPPSGHGGDAALREPPAARHGDA